MKRHAFFSTITWDKLSKRQVTPPFKPVVNRVDETFYFDTEFTSRTPRGKPRVELIALVIHGNNIPIVRLLHIGLGRPPF